MDQLCAVKVFKGFEHLIKNINLVHLFQNIWPHNRMQICLHKLEHQVQVLLILGLDYSVKLDNIIMIELLKYRNFTVGPLGVNRITKCIEHLLKGITFMSSLLLYLPNMAVCATSHLLLENVIVEDVRLDLFWHSILSLYNLSLALIFLLVNRD